MRESLCVLTLTLTLTLTRPSGPTLTLTLTQKSLYVPLSTAVLLYGTGPGASGSLPQL